jgi:hypothetical protein
MDALPRPHANPVRPDEDPELVASRNFNSFSTAIGSAFTVLETTVALIFRTLAGKANSINPVLRGVVTILGTPAYNPTTATGNITLTAANPVVFGNATGGSFTVTLPSAATNPGLVYTLYKVDTSTNTITVVGGSLTVVLGGNSGNSVLTVTSDGTIWRITQLYEEGTYTATLTGCSPTPSATFSYTKVGKAITILTPALVGISNTTACTITGMPSHLFPSTFVDCTVSGIMDNSLIYPGDIRISSAGVMVLAFFNTISTRTGTFTNANTKGIGPEAVISYRQ